jgi:anti-sigma B factor antagonist
MQLHAEKVDGVTIVQLPEKFNSTNTRAFEKDVKSLMESNAKMVFDLAQVTHMDSSGLGSIVACVKHLRTDGGELKICGMSQRIRALFVLVRMHHILDIHTTRQEAIDSYK